MFSSFAQWLTGYVTVFIVYLYNNAINVLQYLSDSVADFLVSIASLFPSGSAVPSYIPTSGSLFDIFCDALNWLFPIDFFVTGVTWLSAGMVLYLVVAPLARWAKLLK